MSYNPLPPWSSEADKGCLIGGLIMLVVLLINFALLAAGAWVVIWVAQQMGVL